MVVRVQRFPSFASPGDASFDIEREIDSLFGTVLNNEEVAGRRTSPSLDVVEQDDETVVIAELPGVRKEDVKVSVHDGILTISGERTSQHVPEKSVWLRNEIRTGQFSRSIQLLHEVQVNSITAELTNGVLRVVLPKAEEARPREIQVR